MNNYWKNKKVVVTGADGFIGRYAVEELLARGAFVTAVLSSRFSKKEKERYNKKAPHLTIVKTDLLILDNCLKVIKNQDIVLNFAALDGGSAFKQEHPAKIFHGNATIILNILEASLHSKVDRVLLMSSIDIYPSDKKGVIKEEDAFLGEPTENTAGYAWAKRFSEITARMYHKEYGMKIAIARPGNVYGSGDDPAKGRVIPTFITKALAQEPIILTINPGKKISFLHVKDLIPALLDLVEKHVSCDPINLVSKQYITLQKLAEIIIKFSGSSSQIITQGLQKQPILDKVISVKKAEKVINFKEKIAIKKGLSDLILQENKTV